LVSDEEEVEDLRAVEQIEEILHATYEKKKRGPRVGKKVESLSMLVSMWNP
jgi:hypothetical protein